MDSIEINGNRAPEPETSPSHGDWATLHAAAPQIDDSNYIILRTKGPLDGPEKQALWENGVIILEYVGNDAYLCGCKHRFFHPSNSMPPDETHTSTLVKRESNNMLIR